MSREWEKYGFVAFTPLELRMARWAVSLGEDDLLEAGCMNPYEKAALGRVRQKLLRAAVEGEDDADR